MGTKENSTYEGISWCFRGSLMSNTSYNISLLETFTFIVLICGAWEEHWKKCVLQSQVNLFMIF